jgi:hypothetical protein
MAQLSSPNNSVLVLGRVLVYSDSNLPAAYGLAKRSALRRSAKRDKGAI